MRRNRICNGVSERSCLYDIPCHACLSHPITDDPAVLGRIIIPFQFHSIPVSFHPFHSSDLSRSSPTGEGVGRNGGACAHAAILCGHPTAHPVLPVASRLTFPSTPRHDARSSTPALVSACILALVEDSLDSADGLGAGSTPDSFRRVVAFHPPPG